MIWFAPRHIQMTPRMFYIDMDMDMEDSKSKPNSSNSGIDMLIDMGNTASTFSLLASLRLDPRRVLCWFLFLPMRPHSLSFLVAETELWCTLES
mmetsp:Transcript_23636/g.48376  ORF Transcript_23636/g.48376 Transcript_23636/m.48376 type:complete len:94 (-) Transcript_23636:188-469(-)